VPRDVVWQIDCNLHGFRIARCSSGERREVLEANQNGAFLCT
jgi:hypothetical protein